MTKLLINAAGHGGSGPAETTAKLTDLSDSDIVIQSINQSINQSILLRINYIHTSHREKTQLSRTGAHTINFSSAAT